MNSSGALPTTRANGSPLQDVDVVLGQNGQVSNYYNGQGWQTPGQQSDVTVSESWLHRVMRKVSNFFKDDDESTQPGGIPLVSEHGGADPVRTRALHPDRPVNIDLLLLTINGYGMGRLPDNFIDAAGTTYDIGTGLSGLSNNGKNGNTSANATSTNPASVNSKTPNLSVNPMFLKKGNVIYHRDGGYKTIINGDGTESGTDKPAKDTFPHDKTLPDYTYPH